MDTEHADAINRLIRRISIRHRAHTDALLAGLGLHAGQDVILLELAAHGPRTQVQLAAAAGCEPPTVTKMVRKLNAAGLVNRTASTTDGRAILVTLTDRGRALVPQIQKLGTTLADHIASGLPATSTAQLVTLLEELESALQRPRAGAGTNRR